MNTSLIVLLVLAALALVAVLFAVGSLERCHPQPQTSP